MTKAKDDISIEYIKKVLRFDAEVGKLFWLDRTPDMFSPKEFVCAEKLCSSWNLRMSGSEAGSTSKRDGYVRVRILKKSRAAHRIIWAMHYGEWPENQIDHINGYRTDNRIENLRDATHSQNQCNKEKTVRNTSGHKGVSWNIGVNRWQSHIQISGKLKNLGTYDDINDAISAYNNASVYIHGEFGRES